MKNSTTLGILLAIVPAIPLAAQTSAATEAVWIDLERAPRTWRTGTDLAEEASGTVGEDFLGQLRNLEQASDWIGERRRRRLATARFELFRDTAQVQPFDRGESLEEMESIVRSCAGKWARERFERSDLGRRWFEKRRDAREQEAFRGWRSRLSPRIHLSDDPYLGVRWKLYTDPSRQHRRFAVGVREYPVSEEQAFLVSFEDKRRWLRLEFRTGREITGDEIILRGRWLF